MTALILICLIINRFYIFRPKFGILYMKKKAPRRYSLKQVVNGVRPGSNTKNRSILDNISPNILEITPENATKIQFYVPCFSKTYRCYPAIIQTEDGAIIIPDKDDFIGLFQMENAFKAMPSVDPKLVPDNWVSNHFKWIVWKLASLERSFPDEFEGCLSFENIMEQLKYRYDREIDLAQRPALRKILEKDDAPGKRMVLCVSAVFMDDKCELELTDGWYGVRTSIDRALRALVEKETIVVGTKLMIQGAELLNCEGCSPLQVIQ